MGFEIPQNQRILERFQQEEVRDISEKARRRRRQVDIAQLQITFAHTQGEGLQLSCIVHLQRYKSVCSGVDLLMRVSSPF